MLLFLVYRLVCWLLHLALALSRNPAARPETVERLALRHEVRVLRCQVKRSAWRQRDRLLLTALSRCLPRAQWGRLAVRPETLLRWHRWPRRGSTTTCWRPTPRRWTSGR